MIAGLLVLGAIVLIWLVFRGRGYKRTPLEHPPGAGWEKTGERFVDPRTRVLVDVWYRPASGERAYVRSPRAAPADPR